MADMYKFSTLSLTALQRFCVEVAAWYKTHLGNGDARFLMLLPAEKRLIEICYEPLKCHFIIVSQRAQQLILNLFQNGSNRFSLFLHNELDSFTKEMKRIERVSARL
jgi:hypothetical protein